jgi:hypothetical protein
MNDHYDIEPWTGPGADDRPTLPRCDPSDGKHRRGCPLFRHPSWGDTDGVCNCSMLYECRKHDRDLSECRDEMAEALPAEEELAAALDRVYAGGDGVVDANSLSDAAAVLAALWEARNG